jgi:hypothetical protein
MRAIGPVRDGESGHVRYATLAAQPVDATQALNLSCDVKFDSAGCPKTVPPDLLLESHSIPHCGAISQKIALRSASYFFDAFAGQQ